jgi:hypothetical protein
MRTLAIIGAWTISAAATVYALLRPESGLLWTNPAAAIGCGLVGVGICLHVRQSLAQRHAACAVPATRH